MDVVQMRETNGEIGKKVFERNLECVCSEQTKMKLSVEMSGEVVS